MPTEVRFNHVSFQVLMFFLTFSHILLLKCIFEMCSKHIMMMITFTRCIFEMSSGFVVSLVFFPRLSFLKFSMFE